MKLMKYLTILTIFLLPIVASADETYSYPVVTLTNGKTYKNVRVLRVEQTGAVLSHSGGSIKVPFDDMTGDLAKSLHKERQQGLVLEAERKRNEEEKFKPRSSEVAFEEWRNFRNHQVQFKGTITTWRIKIASIYRNFDSKDKLIENYTGYLEGDSTYLVHIHCNSAALDKLGEPPLRPNDWIILTGRFARVINDAGSEMMIPIRITREGFKD